jgi:hypothetical protein
VKLIPVDGDPFAEKKKPFKLVPVQGDPFADVPQEDPGVLGSMALGFGRMSDKLIQGAKQMGLTAAQALGNDSAGKELERMAETERFRDEGYAPLQEKRPIASMVGESLPLLAMPMGGSLKAAAALGALPGLVEYGTPEEKLKRGAAGAVGSGVGYGVGKALGAVVSPGMKAASPEAQNLARTAAREGIPLDAAQVTNNPVLQNTKAALSKLPWTATGQAQKAQQQQEAYVGALLRHMGSDGKAATPDVMGEASARLGGNIEGAANSVTLRVDDEMVAGLAKVEKQFLRRLPTDQKPVIQSYLDDLTELIGKGELPGDVYQSTRSQLGQLAAETHNNTVKHSAKEIQKVLDKWFDRQASPEAVKQMHTAREQYSRYATVRDALKRGRNQDGMPSPKQVYAEALGDIPGLQQGKGGEFGELVRAGRQFLPDTIPNSGTPQQQAYMNLLTAGSMGGLGAMGSALSGNDPSTGALLGLAGFGTSKAAQKMLNSPRLTNYLMQKVLEEEEKRFLAQAGGKLGLLGAAASY